MEKHVSDKWLFHGTSRENKKRIMEAKRFFHSNREDDWAGTGIYFFLEENEKDAKRNAKQWAGCIKRFPKHEIAILQVKIIVDEEKILNLTLREFQKIFHKYREAIYRTAYDKAKSKRLTLEKTYTNKKLMDCFVINELCRVYGLQAVIREAYINFNKYQYNEYPVSDIPNCTIFCLRDDSWIEEMK